MRLSGRTGRDAELVPPQGWRAGMLAALLGALAAAALPPVFALPVLLLAFPGLLWLLGAAPTGRAAFWTGFWFGFGFHVFGLYWITDAILLEAADYWWFVPIAVPGLSALLALFIAAPCAAAWHARPGWPRVLVLAGAWTLADIARQFALSGFPWNPLGSVWALPGTAGDIFLQPLAWVGAPGLTFLTVLLACLPALGRPAWAGGLAGLALWAGLGAWRLHWPAPPGPDLTAVLVQGDIPEGAKLDASLAAQIFNRQLELTREGVARAGRGAKVVIWPEAASPYLLGRDALARLTIAEAANGGAPGPTPSLVGALRFGGEPGAKPRNSLFVVTGSGAAAGVYDKWHLVPGGEFQPGWLPLPVDIVPGGGFAPGPGPRTLHVPGLPPFGGLICYEAVFPHQVVDEADRPDWIVNITNDAWFGNSTGPRQHLAAARMRTVEEGLPLVRAANTGISAAFDAQGRELARLGLEREGVLTVKVPGALPPTLFARWGLVLPAFLGGLALAGGAAASVRRRRVEGFIFF